jgi:hypothetical protein
MQLPLSTGQLPLTQAVDRLVEMRVPDLIRQNREFGNLLDVMYRFLRLRGEEEKRFTELSRTSPDTQAKLDAERSKATADLAQALCDEAIPASLIWGATGELISIPAKHWRTQWGMDALRTNRTTLITESGLFEGRVILLAEDFERWAKPEAAPAVPEVAEPATGGSGEAQSPGKTKAARRKGGRRSHELYKPGMLEAARYLETHPDCTYLEMWRHVHDWAVDQRETAFAEDADLKWEAPEESTVKSWIRRHYPELK